MRPSFEQVALLFNTSLPAIKFVQIPSESPRPAIHHYPDSQQSMSSNAPTTTSNLDGLDGAEPSPWLKFGPEFDLAMTKGLETGTFEDSKHGKTVDIHETREAGIASSGVTFVPMSQLKDIHGRPMVYGKKYLFREANHSVDRMTDFEDNNLRRVVNNAKWHDGIHMVLHKRYRQDDHIFYIEYPGRGKWLGGTNADGNDVSLHNNKPQSIWMFQDQGRDSHGFPCYAVWAEQWGAIDYGNGFWMPEYSIARAGYERDYEWRVYKSNDRPPYGHFNIMFERVNYNE
jgi:hypothetical protein